MRKRLTCKNNSCRRAIMQWIVITGLRGRPTVRSGVMRTVPGGVRGRRESSGSQVAACPVRLGRAREGVQTFRVAPRTPARPVGHHERVETDPGEHGERPEGLSGEQSDPGAEAGAGECGLEQGRAGCRVDVVGMPHWAELSLVGEVFGRVTGRVGHRVARPPSTLTARTCGPHHQGTRRSPLCAESLPDEGLHDVIDHSDSLHDSQNLCWSPRTSSSCAPVREDGRRPRAHRDIHGFRIHGFRQH